MLESSEMKTTWFVEDLPKEEAVAGILPAADLRHLEILRIQAIETGDGRVEDLLNMSTGRRLPYCARGEADTRFRRKLREVVRRA